MQPGGLSHLLPTHFPGNLPSPPNIIAFNTHPSDPALVNSLEGVVKECCLFLPFISTPYPMRVYIPREPLGKKLATGLFGRISRQSYVLSLSCPHTWWLLQRPLIGLLARGQLERWKGREMVKASILFQWIFGSSSWKWTKWQWKGLTAELHTAHAGGCLGGWLGESKGYRSKKACAGFCSTATLRPQLPYSQWSPASIIHLILFLPDNTLLCETILLCLQTLGGMMRMRKRSRTEPLEVGAMQACVCPELLWWEKGWGPSIWQLSCKERPQK